MKKTITYGICTVLFLLLVPLLLFALFQSFLPAADMKLILILSGVIYLIAFLMVLPSFSDHEPKQTDDLAASHWSSLSEQKMFFSTTTTSLDDPIKTAGPPVNFISDKELLYEASAVHSLTIGTTASGKSRKIVRQLVMLILKAKESMIFNDPKKEFYFTFRKLLNKLGYRIILIDLRNLQYSDCWNPLDDIIQCFENDNVDDADAYAQDIVTALVEDRGAGEKIWIDGQKAMIKAIILAVCAAPIPRTKKNTFSVYQTLALLGGEQNFPPLMAGGMGPLSHSEKKMVLSVFMDSLKEDDVARIAFTAVQNSPEKTRGSFMTSALSTLHVFSSRKLAKVLSKSSFTFEDLQAQPTAVFLVNPFEKTTYDSIAAMFIQRAFTSLITIANRSEGQSLPKRVHMILDEVGNMPKIDQIGRMVSLSRAANLLLHLFLQDFKQLDLVYGADLSSTIRNNCNIWYFIASADYHTCEEMEKQIGYETIWIDSVSTNLSGNAMISGGGISKGQQRRALLDANELMQFDSRGGDRIIVTRTYTSPVKAYLPDVTAYAWNKEIEIDQTQMEREDQQLHWAIPRYVDVPVYDPSIDSAKRKERVWYWSSSSELSDVIKRHLLEKQVKDGLELNSYSKSNEFADFVCMVDYEEDKETKTRIDALKDEQNKLLTKAGWFKERIRKIGREQRNAS